MLDSPMAVLFRDSYHDLAIWGYEMHRTGWDLIGHSTYRPFIFQGSRHNSYGCMSRDSIFIFIGDIVFSVGRVESIQCVSLLTRSCPFYSIALSAFCLSLSGLTLTRQQERMMYYQSRAEPGGRKRLP